MSLCKRDPFGHAQLLLLLLPPHVPPTSTPTVVQVLLQGKADLSLLNRHGEDVLHVRVTRTVVLSCGVAFGVWDVVVVVVVVVVIVVVIVVIVVVMVMVVAAACGMLLSSMLLFLGGAGGGRCVCRARWDGGVLFAMVVLAGAVADAC
jgi:hypothetical protein